VTVKIRQDSREGFIHLYLLNWDGIEDKNNDRRRLCLVVTSVHSLVTCNLNSVYRYSFVKETGMKSSQ